VPVAQGETSSTVLTQTARGLGTPVYMSPAAGGVIPRRTIGPTSIRSVASRTKLFHREAAFCERRRIRSSAARVATVPPLVTTRGPTCPARCPVGIARCSRESGDASSKRAGDRSECSRMVRQQQVPIAARGWARPREHSLAGLRAAATDSRARRMPSRGNSSLAHQSLSAVLAVWNTAADRRWTSLPAGSHK